MSFRTSISLIFPVVVLLVKYTAAGEIQSLPGLSSKLNFRHFSGYLKTSETHFLFYWFVESQNNPKTDPLLFWFNGGPGCSSLDGLLREMGPYFVNDDGKTLRENSYAWNKFSNVVYLDAPAGVGLSYSSDKNITTNDQQATNENYQAIKRFLDKFPAFRNHSMFLMGESYAGVYVPMLSKRILEGQREFPMNVKGIAIGNGGVIGLNTHLHRSAWMQFAYAHGFISEREWRILELECCKGRSFFLCDTMKFDTRCMKVAEVFTNRSILGGLNVFDAYSPCSKNASKTTRCLNYTPLTVYLNAPKVRTTLGIPKTVRRWNACTKFSEKDYPRKDNTDMSETVQKIVRANISVLLFYGDTDIVLDFLIGQRFSASLGLPLVEEKTPWRFDDQVAGFKTIYKGLTFITVKGAGHQAAKQRAPETAYAIKQFVNWKPI